MAAFSSIALAAMAVGTGVSVYGQAQAAKTAKKVGEYNAGVADQNAAETARAAEYNAQLQEQQALQTEMDSRESIRRRRVENARFQSTQRARFAKAGVTEEGSPLAVMAETAALLELDAQEMNRQAQIERARLQSGAAETRRTGLFQSSQFTKQAGFERMYGSKQASAYKLGAASTLLSGVASYGSMAANFKKAGV
jgi:hypothetical protein